MWKKNTPVGWLLPAAGLQPSTQADSFMMNYERIILQTVKQFKAHLLLPMI